MPYNQKSDVWSLGCILYEMVTLKHAFDASSMKGLVLKILRGTYPEIPSQYSADLKKLISSMLTKDPNKRPSITKVLEMKFLEGRMSKMFLNATSKHEIEVNQLDKKMGKSTHNRNQAQPIYSSIQNRINEKSDRKVLGDITNIPSESKKSKVVKNYINFKKANKKSLKIAHSNGVKSAKERATPSYTKEYSSFRTERSKHTTHAHEEEKQEAPIQKFLKDLPGVS
jgi:serine/threonine protein kinase